MNTITQQNIYSDMDGWGDDPLTDTADDSLWDDYAAPEDDSEPIEDEATNEGDDLQALECELEDAMCNGDMDRADDVEAAIKQLMSTRTPVNKVHSKPIRKKKWVPPPQFGEVKKGVELNFKPVAAMWKKQKVVVNKKLPSVASSLKPKPVARKISGPAPRKQFKTTARVATKTIPDAKTNTFELPEGATIIKREEQDLVTPKQKVKTATEKFVKIPAAITTTISIQQKPWEKFKREERRKFWEQKTKSAAASGDEEAKQFIERSKAREAAFDKLEVRCVKGSLKTQPCKSIMCGKQCRYGDKCKFAHTPEELTVRECHFKCQCRFKHRCQFAHPDDAAEKTAMARKRMADHLAKINK